MSAPRMKLEEILADPTASTWLKNALRTAVERDCVDATNDAEFLAEWLKERLEEIQGKGEEYPHQYTPETCPGRPCGECCDHRGKGEGGPPYDAATATGMYDLGDC